MCADEKAFIRSIESSPGDLSPMLAYADWLKERGSRIDTILKASCLAAAHLRAMPLDCWRPEKFRSWSEWWCELIRIQRSFEESSISDDYWQRLG